MINKEALMNLTKPQAMLRFNDLKKLKGSFVEMIEQDDQMWTVVSIWDQTGAEVSRTDVNALIRDDSAVEVEGPTNEKNIGSLSAAFESNGKPGAIGFDSNGGFSYGAYQIASGVGTMSRFLKFLSMQFPQFNTALTNAGGDVAAREGKDTFRAAWQKLAAEPSFMTAQHAFIAATHYTPFANTLKSDLSLDLDQRTSAMRDVAWSVAVQHGPGNNVFARALETVDPAQLDDAEIFRRVYAERSKMHVYFPSSNKQVQAAVAQRFVKELQVALRRLT